MVPPASHRPHISTSWWGYPRGENQDGRTPAALRKTKDMCASLPVRTAAGAVRPAGRGGDGCFPWKRLGTSLSGGRILAWHDRLAGVHIKPRRRRQARFAGTFHPRIATRKRPASQDRHPYRGHEHIEGGPAGEASAPMSIQPHRVRPQTSRAAASRTAAHATCPPTDGASSEPCSEQYGPSVAETTYL